MLRSATVKQAACLGSANCLHCSSRTVVFVRKTKHSVLKFLYMLHVPPQERKHNSRATVTHTRVRHRSYTAHSTSFPSVCRPLIFSFVYDNVVLNSLFAFCDTFFRFYTWIKNRKVLAIMVVGMTWKRSITGTLSKITTRSYQISAKLLNLTTEKLFL